MSEDRIVHLKPEAVLAEDNVRFSTRPAAIDSMMDSILEHGGVMEPVEASELPTDSPLRKKGYTHSLTYGFTRHAALSRLNKEQNAGLLLPVIVREAEDAAGRVRRQVAENNDRASMSPMDKAVAIKKLKDTGVPVPEIRRIFSSTNGRKGEKTQPMSNAMLNILLRLLDLPKTIQEKIHNGQVGVEAAYVLGKVAPEKRAAVLARAEADVKARLEAEDKDEQKFLALEAKVTDAEKAIVEAEAVVKAAREESQNADAILKQRQDEEKAVKLEIAGMDAPAGPAEVERLKGAAELTKGAQKVAKEAHNKLAKAIEAQHEAEEAVETAKAKVEESRKAKKATKKKVGADDVKKAAKTEGEDAATGLVPLTVGDIRQGIKDLAAGKCGADDRTARVMGLLKDWVAGKDTDKGLASNLNALLDAMGAKLPKAEAATGKAKK